MSDTSAICVHCRKQCASRFEITRFDTSGANKGTVNACSIVCLCQWAYQYATLSGMRLAFGAKAAFENFVATMKGIGK